MFLSCTKYSWQLKVTCVNAHWNESKSYFDNYYMGKHWGLIMYLYLNIGALPLSMLMISIEYFIMHFWVYVL